MRHSRRLIFPIPLLTMAPYFSTITSKSSFRKRFDAELGRTFSELDLTSSNNGGRNSLFAFRVIRREVQSPILPLWSPYTSPTDTKASTEIAQFLDGPQEMHVTQSEHFFVHKYGQSLGQIWAAMTMFKGPKARRKADTRDSSEDESDEEIVSRPARIRTHPPQEDFVDSSMMQIGSSSPPPEGSQGTSSLVYVDLESHNFIMHPEDETLGLLSCVIRHILYFAPPQNSMSISAVVEFRDAKTRLAVSTPNLARKMVAIDDGALCLRQESSTGLFTVVKNRVVTFEAKSHFQCIVDGQPIISDECFAQMTREALVARLADPLRELKHARYQTPRTRKIPLMNFRG